MNMHRQTRKPYTSRLANCVIVVVLLAAACSGSDSGDDSNAAASDGAPVEPTVFAAAADIDTARDSAAVNTDDAVTAGEDPAAGDESGDGGTTEEVTAADHGDMVATLAALLPPNTRQVFAVDVRALLSGDSAQYVAPLLIGESPNPTLVQPLEVIGLLGSSIDVLNRFGSALVVYTSEAGRPALLASVNSATLEDTVDGPMPPFDRTYGPSEHELYLDAAGNQLTLLPGGVVVVGTASAVESIIDVADAVSSEANSISPFLERISYDSDIGFVYALPAMFDETLTAASTLVAAKAVVGALDIVEGSLAGSLTFHMEGGENFVDAFNAMNRASTEGGAEIPLAADDPVVDDLSRVVVIFPPIPLDPDADGTASSLAFFKKLSVGMDALEYASGVADRSEPAWLDFVVKSEADLSEPVSPGSVYIRWEFKDDAAIAAFEENELPAGFRLAPTRFIESDDPEGEIFFALNLYNAAGGSIVGGARAEWDVFVHPPEGADPNAGVRPRFMVVDLLAEEVSADAGNLLTPAEPLSHDLVNGTVVSAGARFDADGVEVPVFELSFPVPDPAVADVARFTREMAIGNDYIYWDHGVLDRVLYNATTFNHDAYLVDVEQLSFTTETDRWSQYLAPEIKDAVYYVNNLHYVASPMANLDSEFLDITPDWLANLVSFTTNGHQDGLMRSAVEQLFLGEGDPFVGMEIGNETPATYYHFEIADPDGLEAALDLPPELSLAPIALFDGSEAAHYLTLSVFEIDSSAEGMRAQWSVYADDGSGRPPHMLLIASMTEQAGFDPATILSLPSGVDHNIDGDTMTTTLYSPTIAFQASVGTSAVAEQALSLDWIEAGDSICSRSGVCDLFYYDAETLDVPVDRASEVIVTEFDTPWTSFVETTPSVVFYRDNAREYAVKRWYNLDVAVEPLPFSGLEDPTHMISGSGSLSGRDADLVDSEYTYTGDAILEDGHLSFAIVQEIENALGTATIFTTGSFDLATASGTQTVVDCTGDALICSDIENGSTALYVAQDLDAADPDEISWGIDAAVDLGSFGVADSASTFDAARIDG